MQFVKAIYGAFFTRSVFKPYKIDSDNLFAGKIGMHNFKVQVIKKMKNALTKYYTVSVITLIFYSVKKFIVNTALAMFFHNKF